MTGNITLNKEERDIVLGSLLGDGCLRKMSRAHNPAFSVSHGEAQKDYVFWKYEKLRRLVNTPPWQEHRVYHKDRTRMLASWRFQTLSSEAFMEFYTLFYQNSRKNVPIELGNLLKGSPQALAVWLMDDGNKNYKAVFLNTQGFILEEQRFLCTVLREVFGLDTTVNKHSVYNDQQLYRVRINTESVRKLVHIVKPYILPQFRYKIPGLSP